MRFSLIERSLSRHVIHSELPTPRECKTFDPGYISEWRPKQVAVVLVMTGVYDVHFYILVPQLHVIT